MALSKPILKALAFYLDQLYEHPIKTNALTCATIAFSGNVASQKLDGIKTLDLRSALAFGTYGLLFSGISHHSFFKFLEWAAPEEASLTIWRRLFLERVIYFPLYQAVALYVIARFEGKTHEVAVDELKGLLAKFVTHSWKYLTVFQLLNLIFVPSMFRIFIHYFTGFFWTMYFAHLRRQYQQKKKSK